MAEDHKTLAWAEVASVQRDRCAAAVADAAMEVRGCPTRRDSVPLAIACEVSCCHARLVGASDPTSHESRGC